MQKYLDADDKLSGLSMKIQYYDVTLEYIMSILKMIANRSYQINASLEFMKFNAGLG